MAAISHVKCDVGSRWENQSIRNELFALDIFLFCETDVSINRFGDGRGVLGGLEGSFQFRCCKQG